MQRCSVPVIKPSAESRYRLLTLSIALLTAGIVTGCSSTPTKTPANTIAKPPKTATAKPGSRAVTSGYQQQDALLDSSSIDSLEGLLSATDMAAVEDNKLMIMRYGDVWRRIRAGFKMDLNVSNSRVEAQRSWFVTRQPYIDRLSARASRYIYYTVAEAERRGIPTELALLPVIESSYDPAATSNAAAAGLWQFIPSTGTIYGLRQNSLYDGRRDVVESTRAAYEFLTSLYNQFGSWELALAAYNAGPGRIQQAINRNRAAGLPTDYWSLRLPTETMNYVPRFIAVAQIVKQPDLYGVNFPSIANRPHFREVPLPGAIDLNMAASIAGLSFQELYELNPGHRSTYTDPMSPPRLLIPAALTTQVDDRLRNMPTLAQTNPQLMASLGPVGGAVIISGGSSNGRSSGSNYSSQQAAALMSAGGVQKTANTTATTTIRQPATATSSASTNTTVTTSIRNPLSDPPPMVAATAPAKPAASTSTPVIAQGGKRTATPGSSSALAAFASQADVPSSPRIPVAVTPAANIKPIAEPAVSTAELQTILATDSSLTTTTTAVVREPEVTTAEKQQVVDELQALVPAGTEVVDPLDGKIKLTAIQTSQSVADAKGEELKIKYEQPVLVTQQNAAKPASPAANTASSKPAPVVAVVAKPSRPAGERMVYAVQPGDTLASIASRHGVNWRDVANWNQINPSGALLAGSSLYLYGAKKPEPVKPASYVVQAGDTLTDVAAKFDMTPRQLADLNGMSATSNLLRGARLSLVENAGSAASKKAAEAEEKAVSTASNKKDAKDNTDNIELVSYKVKRGEYLKLIAERYNISHIELAELNNMPANSSLAAGQSIKVPEQKTLANSSERASAKESREKESKAATTSYTVKSGDTLSRIASRFDTTNEELAKLNKFPATTMVRLGQVITVPELNVAPEKPTTYQVQSGDTLTAVAAKFDMTPQELASLNDMKASSNLIRGATLKLLAEADEKPSKASNKRNAKDTSSKDNKEEKESATLVNASRKSGDDTEAYTVKRGESLHAIAAKYDLSTSELARLNNISAKTMVQVGQTLSVPKLTSSYTVKSGDTLGRLANKFGLSVNELAKLNQMSPTANVIIGDVLVVPANNNRSL